MPEPRDIPNSALLSPQKIAPKYKKSSRTMTLPLIYAIPTIYPRASSPLPRQLVNRARAERAIRCPGAAERPPDNAAGLEIRRYFPLRAPSSRLKVEFSPARSPSSFFPLQCSAAERCCRRAADSISSPKCGFF